MADIRPLRKPRTPTADEVAAAPWLYDVQQIVAALIDMKKQRDEAIVQAGMVRLHEAWLQQAAGGAGGNRG